MSKTPLAEVTLELAVASKPLPRSTRLLLFLGGGLMGIPYYYPTELGAVAVFGALGGFVLFATGVGSVKKGNAVKRNDPLLGLLLMFLIWMQISTFIIVFEGTYPAANGLVSGLKTIYVLGFAYLGLHLWRLSSLSLSWVLDGIRWVNLFVASVVFLTYVQADLFRTWDLMGIRIFVAERFPHMGWPGNYPAILTVCLAITLSNWFSKRGKGKLMEMALAFVFSFVILLSLSRSAWLMSLVVVGAFVLIGANWKRMKIVFGLVAGLASVVLLQHQILSEISVRTFDYQDRIAYYGVFNERFLLWRDAFSRIIEHPLSGFGGIGVNYIIPGVGQLHNEYVDTLFRYGFVGLILLTSVLWLHAMRAFRVARFLVRVDRTGSHCHVLVIPLIAWGGLALGVAQLTTREPLYGPLLFLTVGFLSGFRNVVSPKKPPQPLVTSSGSADAWGHLG